MRIFCAIRHSKNPRFYYGGLWSGNFYPALRQLGHEIVESNVDLLPLSRFMHVPADFTREELAARAEATQRILDEVRDAHRERPIDLLLSYFYNSHFDPAGFDELRHFGIPSINFYCNSIYQFRQVAAIASKADFSWHSERDANKLYLRVGARPVWVQMGADPDVYHPDFGIAREQKGCFVGQRYADRDRLLAALVRAKVPVDIFGAGWATDGEPANFGLDEATYLGRKQTVPGSPRSYWQRAKEAIASQGVIRGGRRLAEQARYRRETRAITPLLAPYVRGRVEDISVVFASCELCLNFSNVWSDGRPGSALIPHVRLRDFEAPMCRTCYLTGYTDEIREFYEVGKEIDTYRTAEELVDKARYHLAHSEAAEKLREAGYCRARRDHTWKKRFQELFWKTGRCT